MSKILVAMSGGVDSSVTAYLLKKNGHDICGAMLKLFSDEDIFTGDSYKSCCSINDVEDARKVADKLGIPFYLLNYKSYFKEKVIDSFVKTYQKGNTPNPCIDCNRYVKFGALFERLPMYDRDIVATGHYAIIEFDRMSGRYLLKKAKDTTKDQSYVLYSLTQNQLAKTLFPLGELSKIEVRDIADKCGFVNAKKPDSQDICFVTKGKYSEFIEKYSGEKMTKGKFIDTKGNVIGEHNGYMNYTIGQRRGIGIAFNKPMYVCAVNSENNTVTLGEENRLYAKTLYAYDMNLIALDNINKAIKVNAKIRYNSKEQPAILHQTSDNEVLVEFITHQKSITSGQAVVFYDGDVVIGGATIK